MDVVPDVAARLAEASRGERHTDLLFIAERSAALGIEYFRAFNLASAVTELESALSTYGRTLAPWTQPDAVAEAWQYLALAELALAELTPTEAAAHEARAGRALREMIRVAPGRTLDSARYPTSVVALYEQAYVGHVIDAGRDLAMRADEARRVSALLGVDQLVSSFALVVDEGIILHLQLWDARSGRFAVEESIALPDDATDLQGPLDAALSRVVACLPLIPVPEADPDEERGSVYASLGYTSSTYLTSVTTERFVSHGAHFGAQWLARETVGMFGRFSQSVARRDPRGELVARVDSTRVALGVLASARRGRVRGFLEGGLDLTRIGPVSATTSFWCKVSEGEAVSFDETRECVEDDVVELDARLHGGIELGAGFGVRLGGRFWFETRSRMSLYVAPFEGRSLDTPVGLDFGLSYRL